MVLSKNLFELIHRYGLSSTAAKGIIELKFNRDSLYLLDVKTPGYPIERFVHHYMIKGGTWTHSEDVCPINTYERELREEIIALNNESEELELIKWMVNSLIKTAKPLADYFYLIPQKVHKKKNKDPMTSIETIFYSKLDGIELCDKLKINNKSSTESISNLTYHFGLRSPESKIIFISEEDYKNGLTGQFGMGDDQIITDYIKIHKGYNPKIKLIDGIKIIKLNSNPLLNYSEKEFFEFLTINPAKKGNMSDDSFYAPYRDT